MNTIDSLNEEYNRVIKNIEIVRRYYDMVCTELNNNSSDPIEKLKNSLTYMSECFVPDGTDFIRVNKIFELSNAYLACIEAIAHYRRVLMSVVSDNESVEAASYGVVMAQQKFNELKTETAELYGWCADSVDFLNETIADCGSYMLLKLNSQVDKIKEEASTILSKECPLGLSLSDNIEPKEALPDKMLIARYALNKETIPLLRALGITDTYKNVDVALKLQGNVVIRTEYERINEHQIDDFIIAYIIRFIEQFPVGAVNVHVFDRNANYLYKRLCNCFQLEDSGEATKKTVKIHNDINDLSVFRDVTCEDIFKKTTTGNPDLFSIYEKDKTEPFNLVILRNGLVDGNGYASIDTLNLINSLTKPDDMGHRCGFRFLVLDDSSSFERKLSASASFLIKQVVQNCGTVLNYSSEHFTLEDMPVEVLHICDDMDTFIQERAKALAMLINNKEQNKISIQDVLETGSTEAPGSIMYIPVGKSGGQTVELPFSCKDENGTVSGQCIGYMVIGQSGSGKSSFFHSLVLNGCMKYPPKELQFWLLDFKNGGASSKYSDSGLPHIHIIAENNKIDDALCLFQMILEEMERRSREFNKNFTDNIIDYNKAAKEKNLAHFPRIIIAIDEVQEIFREDNASTIQKLISSISTRMRSAGMHFVMVAQNLSDGKSYMLKDAFLPSVTGRVCFRVAPEIPRDSGFDDDFIQRKKDIAELKTGEAYVSYGKDTIKKVKVAYTSPQEMQNCFTDIKAKYPETFDMKPLVIGSRKRLSINDSLQGKTDKYFDLIKNIGSYSDKCTAVVGEDVYRMTPFEMHFSQHKNSSVLLLGSDKQIGSALCASIALSLSKQSVDMHMFNGDRIKVQDENESVPHVFMYVCQNLTNTNQKIHNYRPNELKEVIKKIYSEYLKRLALVQKADDEEELKFEPVFLIVNDLLGIESFITDEIIEGTDTSEKVSLETTPGGFDFINFSKNDLFAPKTGGTSSSGTFREGMQNIINILLSNGWRYNIHTVLSVKGDSSSWRISRVFSETNVVMFNTTDYSDQVENSYYVKEMLKNISNDGSEETMSVLVNRKGLSKMRPILYNMADMNEKDAVTALIKGE